MPPLFFLHLPSFAAFANLCAFASILEWPASPKPPQFSSSILTLFTVLTLLGCAPVPNTPAEPDLRQQGATIRAGGSDKILIEHSPFTDQEFQSLAGLENLRTLLIDDPTAWFSATSLIAFSDLPNLEHLRLRGGGINDAALAQIAKLQSLRILNLPHAEFSDAALTHLKALPALEQLRFGTPHVTDAGLQTIAELPALKRLHLINVPITDTGLAVLAGIPQLQSLYIDGANLSEAAIDDLFRRRPDLHIHLNQQHHDRDPHADPH